MIIKTISNLYLYQSDIDVSNKMKKEIEKFIQISLSTIITTMSVSKLEHERQNCIGFRIIDTYEIDSNDKNQPELDELVKNVDSLFKARVSAFLSFIETMYSTSFYSFDGKRHIIENPENNSGYSIINEYPLNSHYTDQTFSLLNWMPIDTLKKRATSYKESEKMRRLNHSFLEHD